MDSAPIRSVQSASLVAAGPPTVPRRIAGRLARPMDVYEIAQLVGFVVLVAVALLLLEAAMRRSRSSDRAQRGGGRGAPPPT